jgi:hypothetical protein
MMIDINGCFYGYFMRLHYLESVSKVVTFQIYPHPSLPPDGGRSLGIATYQVPPCLGRDLGWGVK